MKKMGMLLVFCVLACAAQAQLTNAQVAEKMRPENRVDLPTTRSKTSVAAPATKESLTTEIAALEAQKAKIETAIAGVSDKNDPMYAKYQKALADTQGQIERKRGFLSKMK